MNLPRLTLEQLEKLIRGTASRVDSEAWQRHIGECDLGRQELDEWCAQEAVLRKLRDLPAPDASRECSMAERG